ncbi:PEGA domain-containing protein [Thermococcus sp. GR7]|uniref:PEGA domain-containing protein n=1 Tax=unclassified Thermococcus TaxID=2627626 RepID=UPI0014318D9B|nr:PEGA domain-containing protein [Thermococcus sp. GR7]NJE78840.1 PEGA domain-containing protein [Thermococcus sp. GR4]NJF22145.1 PEGA domain-containing protein [Thermococcus sp. GR5]
MKKLHAILILAVLTFSLFFVNAAPGTPETTGNGSTPAQKYSLGALYVSPEEYARVTGFEPKQLTPQKYLELIKNAPGYPGRTNSLRKALKNLAYPNAFSLDSLPAKVVNGLYLPPVGSQGAVGSCVGWASTYYTWTYMINWFRGNPTPSTDGEIMNPIFTYNLINDGTDSGSYMLDAMNLISTIGAVPLNVFPLFVYGPYGDPDNYAWLWPNDTQWLSAPYNRGVDGMASPIGYPWDIYMLDLTNSTQFNYLKGLLAYGYIAYTGINVYGEFYGFNSTNNIYALNQNRRNYEGGHAVTIVGYDDTKQTPDGQGAFLLLNSWGEDWGDKGYFWLTYQAAQDPNHEISQGYAFVMVPKYPQPYQPKVLAGFKINHPLRGEIIGGVWNQESSGIEIGIGNPDSPTWSRRYLNFYMGYRATPQDLANYQAHPFPNSTIFLDVTDAIEAASAIADSSVVPVYIKVRDKYQDGVTGNLEYFEVRIPVLNRTIWTGVNSQIPEGSDLVVSLDIPLADYISPTPSDMDTLAQSWLYVRTKSLVDVNYAKLVLTNLGKDRGIEWYQVGQPQAIEGTDWIVTVLDISIIDQRAIITVKNAATGIESDPIVLEKSVPVYLYQVNGSLQYGTTYPGRADLVLTLVDTFIGINNNPYATIQAVTDRETETYWMWGGQNDFKVNATGLEPGNYTYQVLLNLTNGNEIKLPERRVTLLGEPVATLKILSRPSNASVYIDGNYGGMTPLTLEIPAGNHTIALARTGYETYTTTVTLGFQESRVIDVVLTSSGDYALFPIGDYPSSVGNASRLFFVFNNLGTPDAFSTALYVSPTVSSGANVRRTARLASTFDLGEVSPGDTVVSVGGPLVNPITARYDNVSMVHMEIFGGTITIVTPQGNVTWTAPKPWWNVTQGYFVIQSFADRSLNATVFTIYGTDADSTAAGTYYFLTKIYPNIESYRNVQYIVGLWQDTEPGADIPLPGADQGDTSGFSAGDSITIVFMG